MSSARALAAPTWAQVRAIFANHCLSCHDAKEADGELVMESYELLMKGGEKGRDIIPGRSSESRLFQQITHQIKPFMPPPKKAAKLPEEEIALIRAWIDAGAPGPKAGEVATPTSRPASRIRPTVALRRPVLSLAASPTANLVAVARPGEVEIWSVEQQGVVQDFRDLPGDVNAVAFSADGKTVFAAGGEPGVVGRVWRWNTADWKPLGVLQGHTDAIYSLAVAPSGKMLATGSYDQKILLWDLSNIGTPRSLTGHNGAVFSVAFRPDGNVLASVSADRTLKLWDVKTGQRLDTRPEPLKDLYGLAWSPDGSRVAAGGVDNRIRIWKVSPSAVEGSNVLEHAKFAHDGTILRIAWTSDGKFIASGADNNTLRLFNAADMTQKLTFPTQSDWPGALAFADGGKTLVVGRIDGSLSFYRTQTGEEVMPPAPELNSAAPRGIQRGHASRIKLTGKNLCHITQVKVSSTPGKNITARILPDATLTEAWLEVLTPNDLSADAIDVTLVGRTGKALPLKLHVDDLPQVAKDGKGGTSLAQAQLVSMPASVWGTFVPAGAANFYAVDVKKGQALVFDVAARRIGSKAQVALAMFDDKGRMLSGSRATGDDTEPLVTFTAPADGRYTVKVSDLTAGGTSENYYRLSVGDSGYVTGVFPLGVPVGKTTRVQLLGTNLPADASIEVAPSVAGDLELSVDPKKFRSRRPLKVVASSSPELIEPDTKDAPAMELPVPGAVSGRIGSAGEADVFRFQAKVGVSYTIETLAAQRGSPIDTRIQVLHADGRPVQRLQLRAVRDSNITFRGFDANDVGARFPNYEEMDLDQFVYMNGEVVRLFRYPEGPDSNFFFYTLNGKRRCFFDTTATAHPLDEKCYIVEPHALGEKLAPNGLPVIPLNYENDDESNRLLASDSRLMFKAPADGTYKVRVTDTRGFGGRDYVYRLTIRPSQPDFSATIVGYDANPPAGAGKDFTVKLDRIDGFDGPVRIDISEPPAGFAVSSPIIVEAGQWEAMGTLYASVDAPTTMPAVAMSGLKATASAIIDGNPVTRSLPDLKWPSAGTKSPVLISLEPVTSSAQSASRSVTVIPGKLTPAWLRVKRNGYNKPMSFDARNLPHGVYVADVGLNGIHLLEGQSERQIFIQCAPWVAPTQRPAYLRVRDMANPTTPPVAIIVADMKEQKAAR